MGSTVSSSDFLGLLVAMGDCRRGEGGGEEGEGEVRRGREGYAEAQRRWGIEDSTAPGRASRGTRWGGERVHFL